MEIVHEVFEPNKADLIRETFLVIFGLFIRWFELRKKKNNEF